jgi:hypothetical protein
MLLSPDGGLRLTRGSHLLNATWEMFIVLAAVWLKVMWRQCDGTRRQQTKGLRGRKVMLVPFPRKGVAWRRATKKQRFGTTKQLSKGLRRRNANWEPFSSLVTV